MANDVAKLIADASLLESPRVVGALEDFVVEAIEEATDLLRHGDMTTRTTLIRQIVSMALKSKDSTSSEEAERVLAETRKLIGGIVE